MDNITTADTGAGVKKKMGAPPTHGATGTPTYFSWQAMRKRCRYKKHPAYHMYGGRGISVCERWINSFENFLIDMGERPEGTTIDRYPNKDGNYEPGNCRWATDKQQAQNTRFNRIIEWRGEKLTVMDWATKTGVKYTTLKYRLDAGWPLDLAMEHQIRGPHVLPRSSRTSPNIPALDS